MMSDTTLNRWKENQPLTHQELLVMRLGIAWRLFLAVVLIGWITCTLCGCKTVQAKAQEYRFSSFSGKPKTELSEKRKAASPAKHRSNNNCRTFDALFSWLEANKKRLKITGT